MSENDSRKERLREQIRNAESLIRELEKKSDPSAKQELARQKQIRDNLQYELDRG